jgi:hypothetical protein
MEDRNWKRIRRTLEIERAVSRSVADERGYRPFAQGAHWVRDLFPDIPNKQWGATFGRLVKRTSGIVIPKHPVPGEPPILPQLRPDNQVELWPPERHDHAEAYPNPRVRGRHEAGKRHGQEGVRVNGEHAHPRDPKYLLAPSPLVDVGYLHAHGAGTSEEHRRKPHDEPEGTTHAHMKRDKDRENKRELRIDVHPASLRMLQGGAPRAFFSIEGSIKADAILSQGEPAFAVPSVTMWPAPELERFAQRYLWPSTRTYVVPDADWSDKPDVALQAFVCVDVLRGYGVEAAVAAVPRGAGAKGVDDFLADRGRLDKLMAYRRELTPAFRDFVEEIKRYRPFGEIRARDRLVDVLKFIVLHADEQGRCRRTGKTIAKYTDVSRKRLDAMLGDYNDISDDLVWEVDGKPFLTYHEWEGWDVDRGRRSRFGEFEVTRPDIRAETTERPLAED